VQTHAGQAVLEEARRIARQELATDDPSYASYDDNTTTTTTWPRDPGAVFNTTPDGNHVVLVTIKTPLTGGKPEDPDTTNDTPPASSQGPQSHPLPEEDADAYTDDGDNTTTPVEDHVAAPATHPATRPAIPEEATTSDAATAGATTASNDYNMPASRPASPFLEASRRHQEEDTTPAPLQTTTLEEENLSETLPNSAFHIDDEDTIDTPPAAAGETLTQEESAPAAADLPAGDATAAEEPAASWGSGAVPSNRPSTTGDQQQEETEEKAERSDTNHGAGQEEKTTSDDVAANCTPDAAAVEVPALPADTTSCKETNTGSSANDDARRPSDGGNMVSVCGGEGAEGGRG
jgi:hypothetical protein